MLNRSQIWNEDLKGQIDIWEKNNKFKNILNGPLAYEMALFSLI